MTTYLPIMLDCRGQRCVVVGGGTVAERKIDGLLEAGAEVTVISPALTPRLSTLAEIGRVKWLQRGYTPGDMRGAFLVYAASSDKAVNGEVAREARSQGLPVNVASHAEAGSFITPAVLRRGRLTVAVSTSGAGPGEAIRIKGLLEDVFGQEYESYLEFLHQMRTEIKRQTGPGKERERLLRRLGALDVLNEMREGTFIEWGPEVIDAWILENREE